MGVASLGLPLSAIYELSLPELVDCMTFRSDLNVSMVESMYRSMRIQTTILYNLQVPKKYKVNKPEELIKFSFDGGKHKRKKVIERPTIADVSSFWDKIDAQKNGS